MSSKVIQLVVFLIVVSYAVGVTLYNLQSSYINEEIRFQGEQARETGLPVFVNPYENEKGQIWLDGWMEGVNND